MFPASSYACCMSGERMRVIAGPALGARLDLGEAIWSSDAIQAPTTR
jgi:hypothetical protein